MIVAEAIIGPTSLPPSSEAKIEMPSGGVASDRSLTTSKGQKKSFQWLTIENTAKAASAGLHERHQNEPQGIGLGSTVNASGVHQLLRNSLEALAQQKDPEVHSS